MNSDNFMVFTNKLYVSYSNMTKSLNKDVKLGQYNY